MIKMKETLNNFIPNIKKIITYLRGNTIDGQRIYIQRWAKQNGFHIQK
jgi:hypothetical protein